jgi:hypothetical protein
MLVKFVLERGLLDPAPPKTCTLLFAAVPQLPINVVGSSDSAAVILAAGRAKK